jgi:two-component system sensor histidine kinase RstB
MRRLYFRIIFGVFAVVALSFFLPGPVLHLTDRIDMRPPGAFPSDTTVDLLRDRLETTAPEDLQRVVDSLAPLIGRSLVLLPSDARLRPTDPRNSGDGQMPFGGPGGRMALIDLPAANKMVSVGPGMTRPRPSIRSMVVLVSLVLLIAGAAGFLMVAPMVRNLRRLELAASRFGHGELDARAAVPEHDVVGGVAVQFNVMADSIQKLIRGERHLLQSVSHELRTPISRIRFSLDMLKQATSETERTRREREIDDEIVEIDTLVGELLDYNRLNSGATSLSGEVLSVGPLVDEVTGRLADFRAGIAVSVITESEQPCQVMADRLLIRRVIQNLLLNALRYAHSQVVIRYARDCESVVIEVSDDGPGIPAAERERVLQPFVRVDDSRSKESGGVGLGLAIVNRIMHLHGGSVTIDRATIGGARFVTVWPDSPIGEAVPASTPASTPGQ